MQVVHCLMVTKASGPQSGLETTRETTAHLLLGGGDTYKEMSESDCRIFLNI